MTKIGMKILDKDGQIKVGKNDYEELTRKMVATGEEGCYLATQNMRFLDGDIIEVTCEEKASYLVVKLDETLDSSLIYLPTGVWHYLVTMEETAVEARSDMAFRGKRHYLSARLARPEEIKSYRNLALNPHDQKEFTGAYPHAYANVETRNDATFFACNAINGLLANHSHGSYPYQSWGINRQADAEITIDFGREVVLDQVGITIRGDFPHDSYWEEVTLAFSDGSQERLSLGKISQPQYFSFEKRIVSSVTLGQLQKAKDESPFPALTELELFGVNH